MTAVIDFKDAVNPAALDPNARYAVFYIDGAFANEAAVRARCPHAKLFAITTQGRTGRGIFACDSELGDLTVAQTEAWVAEQIRLGVELIAVYANLDRWLHQGLRAALSKYGSRIKRWVADWNGNPNSLPWWADADQYDSLPDVDLDAARATFFAGVKPKAKPRPKPKLPKPKPPHPKTAGATAGAALAAAIYALLHAAGVHVTPLETAAIATVAAAIGGTVTPAKAS